VCDYEWLVESSVLARLERKEEKRRTSCAAAEELRGTGDAEIR